VDSIEHWRNGIGFAQHVKVPQSNYIQAQHKALAIRCDVQILTRTGPSKTVARLGMTNEYILAEFGN
jgi:hypothetical protein